ncbi:hypothetical protein ACOME3_003465 [Neoechinorhynchus agilis]
MEGDQNCDRSRQSIVNNCRIRIYPPIRFHWHHLSSPTPSPITMVNISETLIKVIDRKEQLLAITWPMPSENSSEKAQNEKTPPRKRPYSPVNLSKKHSEQPKGLFTTAGGRPINVNLGTIDPRMRALFEELDKNDLEEQLSERKRVKSPRGVTLEESTDCKSQILSKDDQSLVSVLDESSDNGMSVADSQEQKVCESDSSCDSEKQENLERINLSKESSELKQRLSSSPFFSSGNVRSYEHESPVIDRDTQVLTQSVIREPRIVNRKKTQIISGFEIIHDNQPIVFKRKHVEDLTWSFERALLSRYSIEDVSKQIDNCRELTAMRIQKTSNRTLNCHGRLFRTKWCPSNDQRVKLCQLKSHMTLLAKKPLSSIQAAKYGFQLRHAIRTREGGLLVPNPEGIASSEEFAQALRDCKGVCASKVSNEWVANHYRWIVWKLGSYQAKFMESSLFLSVDNVMEQLRYRYDIEVYEGRRSCLKRIMEGDSSFRFPLVLLVSNIFRRANRREDVELSDGWYSIRANVNNSGSPGVHLGDSLIDEPLKELISRKRIRMGCKLYIDGLCVDFGQSGFENPLKSDATARLCLNSCRRCRWYARLGFHRKPMLLSLEGIHRTGGIVPLVHGIVVRAYPISKGNSDESYLHRVRIACAGQSQLTVLFSFWTKTNNIDDIDECIDVHREGAAFGFRYMAPANYGSSGLRAIHGVTRVTRLEVHQRSLKGSGLKFARLLSKQSLGDRTKTPNIDKGPYCF